MYKDNVRQSQTEIQDNSPGEQQPAQVAQQGTEYGNGDPPANAAPASAQPGTLTYMRAAKRWLVWTANKQPFYLNGKPRKGKLDTESDWKALGTYEQAKLAVEAGKGKFAGIGFALGPDGTGGHWQGIDLDDVQEKHLSDIANALPGYVELSPSGNGAHAIGYGRDFKTLGSNGSGVEAYAKGRYFTFTESMILDSMPVCLASFVEQTVAPRHNMRLGQTATTETMTVDPKTVSELRSALLHMRSDEYELWIRIGLALKELGDTGRGLWLEWSVTSEKYNAKEAGKKWEGFDPQGTGYQAVFAEAQRRGWVNPSSNEAQLNTNTTSTGKSGKRELDIRRMSTVSPKAINWLWTGWIPQGYLTIWVGETGAGKSTVLADVTARETTGVAWPGEHPDTKRQPGRVLWLGSEDGAAELTVPRLMACGADLDRIDEIRGVKQGGEHNTFSLQDDIANVRFGLNDARERGAPYTMLVIDPVTSYLPGQKLRKVDMNDAGQIRTILEPWMAISQEHNLAIVAVTHLAKNTTRSLLHRVLGSGAFAHISRSLCAVVERPDDGLYAKALLQVNINLPDHPGGAWKFSTEKVKVCKDEENQKPIHATRPKWETLDSAITPESLAGGERGPVNKTTIPFTRWVKAHFMDTPYGQGKVLADVKAAALSAGIITEWWWDANSAKHLEKKNFNGVWYCRLK